MGETSNYFIKDDIKMNAPMIIRLDFYRNKRGSEIQMKSSMRCRKDKVTRIAAVAIRDIFEIVYALHFKLSF